MRLNVAVAGKGGTGKTTVSGLLIDSLRKFGKPILAVDADPNNNLHQWLGVELKQTLGDICDEVLSDKGKTPVLSKKEILSMSIARALTESTGFDFLAMGRTEGPGCYCYVNNVLRNLLDEIEQNYNFVIMDSEAGMEHISRRTTRKLDILLLVADPTKRGIITAKHISRMAKKIKVGVKKEFLILNSVSGVINTTLKELIEKEKMNLLSVVPEDPEILKLSEEGKSLKFLPRDSLARREIDKVVENIFAAGNIT